MSQIHAISWLEVTSHKAAILMVSVLSPSANHGGDGLILMGNIQAYNSAGINARATGYMRQGLADIGDLVMVGNAASQPLFTVPNVQRMRIYVRVPQVSFPHVQPGTQAVGRQLVSRVRPLARSRESAL